MKSAENKKTVLAQKNCWFKTGWRKEFFTILGGFVLSALMLSLIQPPLTVWPLAWVALVPFILVCKSEYRLSFILPVSFAVGSLYWLVNAYWLGPVTMAGWIAMSLLLALIWVGLAFSIRWSRGKNWPMIVVAGLLFTGAEQLQGVFFGGFYWRFLAFSQYTNLSLIQMADIFGAAGVSLLIALVNGAIADSYIAWRRGKLLSVYSIAKPALALMLVLAAIVYGQWRLEQTKDHVEKGPVIASVQSNVPQSVKESHSAGDQMLADMLEESRDSASAEPALIVWPETMVQATLDKRVLQLLESSHPYRVYDRIIGEHAKEVGSFLLVGSHGARPQINEDASIYLRERYNSAFLYKPDGSGSNLQYDKIHLVPFGETIPFRESAPFIYRILMKFSPYDYDYSLDPGRNHTIFQMFSGQGSPRNYSFGVLICYESTNPRLASKFVVDEKGNKISDWLLNISNDGWFVRFENDKVLPSTELSQHASLCVFRAIENRVAIVRSVNTGISCMIDSTGRIIDGYLGGNLPEKAMERQGMSGWFADNVPIDNRVSFYSRYGGWVESMGKWSYVLLLILPAGLKILKKQQRSDEI